LYNWWPYVRDTKLWVSTWKERRRLAGSGNNGDDAAVVATGEAARRYFSAKEFFTPELHMCFPLQAYSGTIGY
jgi:hypothetical protein